MGVIYWVGMCAMKHKRFITYNEMLEEKQIKTINAYKTSDGKVWEFESLALAHQATIKTRKEQIIDILQKSLPENAYVQGLDIEYSYNGYDALSIKFIVPCGSYSSEIRRLVDLEADMTPDTKHIIMKCGNSTISVSTSASDGNGYLNVVKDVDKAIAKEKQSCVARIPC